MDAPWLKRLNLFSAITQREMQHGAANVGGWAVRLVAQYVTACKIKGWLLVSRAVLSLKK